MAQNAPPSNAAGHFDGKASTTGAASTPVYQPQQMAPSAFQAVNSMPFTAHLTPGKGSNNLPAPPKDGPAAQTTPQAGQLPSNASQALRSAVQADGLDGATPDTSATYGTRSRNRAGNPRPNYAEDQEMEVDSTLTSTKRKAPADPLQNASEAKRGPEHPRPVGGNMNGLSANTDPGRPKESTPATTSVSKKRKAGGVPAAVQTPPANSPVPNATRKWGAATATGRETNIMTFWKHKSCLNKKGELVADDGTKLSVDGKPASPFMDSRFEVEAYPALADASAVLGRLG